MRRTYAFESDCPENVKAELEKVEAAVDENCASSADCDKVLAKIDDQAEKFDDALKSMANAAKDAKAGGDQAAATASIKEAQADLKQIAKTIGVANESDSEYADREEIEAGKAYLEGAREIVEAKKDELGDGSCDDGECDDANEACEAWLDAYSDALADALESEIYDGIAMEGATSDGAAIFWSKHKELNAMKKEMNAAAKSGDYKTAAAKARECANIGGEMESAVNSLPQDLKASVIVKIAMAVASALASAAVGAIIGGRKGAKAYKNSRDGQWAAEKLADAKELHKANGQNKRNVKGFAKELRQGTITGAAKGAAKPAAIGGGGAALVAGAAAGASFLRKKKVVDEEGNTHSERLQPNEYNTVLNLIKADAKRIKAAYTKKAEAYDAKASEAPAADATESFVATMESLMINGSCVDQEIDDGAALEAMIADMDINDAEEAIENVLDAYNDELLNALESDVYSAAMEGANAEGWAMFSAKHKEFTAARKEMNAAAKAKDYKTAAAKARECANIGGEIETAVNQIPQDTKAAILVRVAVTLAVMLGSAVVGGVAARLDKNTGRAWANSAKTMKAEGNAEGLKRARIRQAKNVGTAAGINAGVAAAAGTGSTAIAMLRKKKVVDEEGNTHSERLQPNDTNWLLKSIRVDAKHIKTAYTKKAEEFDKKASAGEGGGEPAAESWLLA